MEAARIKLDIVPEYPKRDITVEIKIKPVKNIEIKSSFFLLKENKNREKRIIE